ncbi:glycoside hydrolase family 35 protein [Silvibacterium acidisoli]|uniref:glycoside hydrolase family 35 protein n=1 Tax=Acidobacteriaceae bacterium ZG23-2 TaxID=2883246 RepID=UPI00406C1EF5
MSKRVFRSSLLLAASLALGSSLQIHAQVSGPDGHPHTFGVDGDHFALDGKPFQIISGAIHYERIPRAYWRDRLRKAKAMGLNTVETYAFWNAHEKELGKFDFSGQNDIAEFIREAQQEGLYVVLRPGPYACAEWEFGGYPPWLMKDPKMVVRSSYPGFIDAVRSYMQQLAAQTAPLQIGNGGPIIAVQVENEYGSYGDDHAYVEQIHHILVDAGYTKAMLYTADGADVLAAGTLPELPAAINFGVGDAKRSFALLDKFRPNTPRFNSEYWDGWFDHWGHAHETRGDDQQAQDLEWMLSRGYSVNIYMVDGGTSFGWMNGANIDDGQYHPDVTSYDYDAAIAESGELRPKYFRFRDIITKVTGVKPPAPPEPIKPIALAAIPLNESSSLWKDLPTPVHAKQPLTMEAIDQSYGYILYRTRLHKAVTGTLSLPGVHDYAQVYVDGVLQGTVDRRLGQTSVELHAAGGKKHAQLDILVENTGRVNYGKKINGERAGLLETPSLDGKSLQGWDIFPLPMKSPQERAYSKEDCTGACFYRASFQVEQPSDTFLDTGKLNKGMVWINGVPLGRFWNIGPQRTLYLPGPWLRPGANEIVIFDLNAEPGRSVEGLKTPILDAPVK